MNIAMIVAMASNRVIGYQQQIPWHLSADLRRFKQITMGAPIIMGRKTYESIGRPLPGRTTIIVSRDPTYQVASCHVFCSLADALAHYCDSEQTVFIVGGASLYEEALPLANTLYLTEINQDFDGDTWFPVFDKTQWQVSACESIEQDPQVSFTYRFVTLQRAGDQISK